MKTYTRDEARAHAKRYGSYWTRPGWTCQWMNECWDPDKGRFWSPGIGDAPSELGVDRPDQVDGWIMAHPGTDNSPTEASAEPESPEVVTRDEIERMAKYLAQLAQDPDMSERRSQQLANAAAMLRGILR